MRRYGWAVLASICGGTLTSPLIPSAGAAPFCVRTRDIGPQCLYVDASSCNAEAHRIGGYCTLNLAEARIPPGIGHFCMVTSGMVANCVYPDETSCGVEARRQNGVCIAQPARAESPAPDPYRAIRPLTAGGGARE